MLHLQNDAFSTVLAFHAPSELLDSLFGLSPLAFGLWPLAFWPFGPLAPCLFGLWPFGPFCPFGPFAPLALFAPLAPFGLTLWLGSLPSALRPLGLFSGILWSLHL